VNDFDESLPFTNTGLFTVKGMIFPSEHTDT
jgi:hypothetical protein